jgi:hypothetical protein
MAQGEWMAKTISLVHLSFRHLFTAITSTDADTRMAILAISSADPKQHEAAYHEVCDAFFQISKLTSAMILGMLMLRH